MQGVLAAARAVFLQFHPPRVVAAVLLSCIIPFLTLGASQGNDRTNVFLGCHFSLPSSSSYWIILVTTPAPTVRPPSRMANFEPCSNATGTISSTSRFTLSPGITISTPSGSLMLPVTSIVRM